MTTRRNLMIGAAASGLMLTAAFPKIGWDWLAWMALIPFGLTLRNLAPSSAFRFGLLTGIFHYLTLLYWLVPTMRIYGFLPWPLCIAILFLFSCILAFFVGAIAWSSARLAASPLLAMLWLPTAWTAGEYARSVVFTGFPWELLGHSQYARLPIIQMVDLAGVYGLSFVMAAANMALVLIVMAAGRLRWQGRPVTRRQAIAGALAAAALAGGSLGYGHYRLTEIDALQAEAPTARLAAIQGNIPQSEKWDEAFKEKTIAIYLRLSLGTRSEHPELIVWPETAAPFYFMVEEKPTRQVMAGIHAGGADFLIGSPSVQKRDDTLEFFNSAWLIDRHGRFQAKYDKAHLVPFGEYTPFKEWLPFLGKIVAQVGDFLPGPKGRTIDWNGRKLGVQICYEAIFPYLSRAQVRNGADLLVNITNDAWYGKTGGPYQHFSIVVLRAVENRRALLRAANTGISGFVDPAGRVLSATPLFEEAAVVQSLPLLALQSVYTRFGDLFAKACLIATVAGIMAGIIQRKMKRR